MRIIARSQKTGKEEEITDFYWFEENGVHGWDGKGHHDTYTFRFVLRADDMNTLFKQDLSHFFEEEQKDD